MTTLKIGEVLQAFYSLDALDFSLHIFYFFQRSCVELINH